MSMRFENAHMKMLERHSARRSGERLRRLREGHGYGEKLFLEKVWWPALGSFDDLHPEYEVNDYLDGKRYLDFAVIRGGVRMAIEIDGFGPHAAKLDRKQFANGLMRQNYLVMDGWKVIRLAVDDLESRPRMCQQLIQQCMGLWFNMPGPSGNPLTAEERVILRFIHRTERNITSSIVCELLSVGREKAQVLLKRLVSKGFLIPAGAGQIRIFQYAAARRFTSQELAD